MYNVFSDIILRNLNCLCVSRDRLSEVLCIYEFKGDSGNIKYHTSLLDGSNHSIIDILPARNKNFLFSYFRRIFNKNRQGVKFFVSNMCKC